LSENTDSFFYFLFSFRVNKKMALSNPPFSDLGLSNPKIDDNYTWKNVRQLGNRVDEKIFVDFDRDILIASNEGSTVDAVSDDIVALGTDIIIQNGSDEMIIIGHQLDSDGAARGIVIGGSDAGDRSGVTNNSVENIAIGYDQVVGSVAQSDGNIIVGNTINVSNGSRNVIVGHAPGIGGTRSDVISLTNRPLAAPLGVNASGAVILGGGKTASALPRFQLLSQDLVNLQGTNVATQWVDGTTFAIPNINGYVRMRYKDKNILIPAIVDPDDAGNPAEPA
jgi:hypothetical protein